MIDASGRRHVAPGRRNEKTNPWSVETMTIGFKKSRANYPLGILAIYDNGGRADDRYMVVLTPFDYRGELRFPTIKMSSRPDERGIGMLFNSHESRPIRPRGARVIGFSELPAAGRRHIESRLRGREIECPHCGGLGPELIAAGPHAGERCRVCVSH